MRTKLSSTEKGFSLAELMTALAIAAILLSIATQSFNSMMAGSRTRAAAETILSGLVKARSEAIKRNAPMRFQLVTTTPDTANCGAGGEKYVASATSAIWVVTQYVSDSLSSRGVAATRCATNPYTPDDQEEPCRLMIPVSASATATGWVDYRAFTAVSPPASSDCAENTGVPLNFRMMCRPMGNPTSCRSDPMIAAKGPTTAPAGVTIAGQLGTTTISPPNGFVVTFGALGQLLYNLEEAPLTGNRPGSVADYNILVTPSAGEGRRWNVRVKSNGTLQMCDPDIVDTTNALRCP